MAKIKDELLVSQEVIPCKVLTMHYVSDTVLGIEDKTMNRNKSPYSDGVYFQVKGEATSKYILDQVVMNLGATSIQMLSDIPCVAGEDQLGSGVQKRQSPGTLLGRQNRGGCRKEK